MTHAHTHQWVDGNISGRPWPGLQLTRNYTGGHKRLATQNQVGDADALRHTQRGHKRAERSAAPRMGTARGPRADPANPAATHPPSPPRPPQSGPPTWPQGLESRRAGASRRRRPPASVSFGHRSPAVRREPGGGASSRPAVPSAPGPAAPAAVATLLTDTERCPSAPRPARPGCAAPPHQRAPCQPLSEPRAAAAAVAPASAAAPLPSWLRPEVTSAGRPTPTRCTARGPRPPGAPRHDYAA